jgi:hypothetical protein
VRVPVSSVMATYSLYGAAAGADLVLDLLGEGEGQLTGRWSPLSSPRSTSSVSQRSTSVAMGLLAAVRQHVAVVLEGAVGADGQAVHGGDDVAGQDAGLGGRGAGGHACGPDAGDPAASSYTAQPLTPRDSWSPELQLLDDALGQVGGDGVELGGRRLHGAAGVVHAGHLAVGREQRPAGVARLDVGVVLDGVVDRRRPGEVATRLGLGHDALGERELGVTEGEAGGVDVEPAFTSPSYQSKRGRSPGASMSMTARSLHSETPTTVAL